MEIGELIEMALTVPLNIFENLLQVKECTRNIFVYMKGGLLSGKFLDYAQIYKALRSYICY